MIALKYVSLDHALKCLSHSKSNCESAPYFVTLKSTWKTSPPLIISQGKFNSAFQTRFMLFTNAKGIPNCIFSIGSAIVLNERANNCDDLPHNQRLCWSSLNVTIYYFYFTANTIIYNNTIVFSCSLWRNERDRKCFSSISSSNIFNWNKKKQMNTSNIYTYIRVYIFCNIILRSSDLSDNWYCDFLNASIFHTNKNCLWAFRISTFNVYIHNVLNSM